MLKYLYCMIKSFKNRRLKRFYDRDDSSRLPPDMIEKIADILADLEVAQDVQDMNLPHYRLHQLAGDRKGQWSVTVRANWRIVFGFDDGAYDVDFVDYH